ncbi:MAG: transporter substrate-binding domain-containing protein [Chloroflexota bacterium]|nr:transporter substrate-binding domain-containing protein [Chloroflexota bacterium]
MTRHKRTFAPLALALVLAPTVFAACSSSRLDPIPSGAALTCADQASITAALKHSPRLTLGTVDPGTPPWWGGDPNEETINMPAGGSGWTQGNPYAMEGFEGGVSYSLANSLGFESDEIDWVKVSAPDALAAGAKEFDLAIAQVASRVATDAVDVSDVYYSSREAVVTLSGRSIATATSVASLATYRLGAVAGSAGGQLVTSVVKPAAPVTPFADLAAAIAGLRDGSVDGLVVNVNVAVYMRDSWHEGDNNPPPLPEAVIVGQFAPSAWSDDFVVVLQRSSPLTACVNEAVDEIRRQGLIDEYISEYITNTDAVPALQ